jgi:hypothetical protein
MSTADTPTPAKPGATLPRDEGILRFFSSEAEALLAQYRRVDYLLGRETHEHTHSGTLCEVLLRDYLRRVLLPWMGVDKGFIYGRTEDGTGAESSPEIDLLIHDQREYRPLFRMEDFVVVQPEAVLGIIQVKKRLTTSGRNPLGEGLRNVMKAKRHLLTQLRLRHADYPIMERARQRVVSVLLGFEGRTIPATYWHWLDTVFSEFADSTDCLTNRVPDRLYLAPHFVGSLEGRFCVRQEYNETSAQYRCFPSVYKKHNVSAQVLADILAKLIWSDLVFLSRRPLFQYPEGFTHISEHTLT